MQLVNIFTVLCRDSYLSFRVRPRAHALPAENHVSSLQAVFTYLNIDRCWYIVSSYVFGWKRANHLREIRNKGSELVQS